MKKNQKHIGTKWRKWKMKTYEIILRKEKELNLKWELFFIIPKEEEKEELERIDNLLLELFLLDDLRYTF